MRIKFGLEIAAMLAMAATVGCTQAAAPPVENAPAVENKKSSPFNQTTVPGSYIVKASGDGNQVIRRAFAEYGVTLVKPLGNDQFELRLSRDPGLDVLKKIAAGTNGAVSAIQPNFVYHSD